MINFTIYKTEIRLNLKMILIWSTIFSLMIILTLSLFDATASQQDALKQLLKTYPPEFIKAFNINSDSFATVEGYFSGKSLSLMIIANAVLAIFLGANGIGKELSSKTISFLITKPVSRLQIYLSKTAVGISLLLISNSIFAVVGFISTRLLTSDKTASIRYFAGLFFLMWLMQIIFFGIGQLVSTFISDAQAIIVGTALVFGSWILDIVSNLPSVPEFVKYLTPLHYVNSDYIHQFHALKLSHIAVLLTVGVIILIITAWRFNRRDIEI